MQIYNSCKQFEMKHILIIVLVGIFNLSYSQSFPELEKILINEFPESSTEDGRWVFYKDKTEIEKLDSLGLKSDLKNFNIYKVILTNYLGYHVNQGICVVLLDSSKSNLILVEPIWYGGISESLIKSFINTKFNSKSQLTTLLADLHTIQEIGSGYKFIMTNEADDKLYYDLVYFEGDSYTTGSEFSQSTVRYNSDGVYRKIEVGIKKFKIKEYVIFNPRLEGKEEYKDSYKQVIK